MENIKKLQELDGQLIKLEREYNSSNEKQTMSKMSKYVKDAQNKSIELENTAKDIIKQYNNVKAESEKQYAEIKKLVSKDEKEMTIEEMQKVMSAINQKTNDLYALEKRLGQISLKMKETLKEFEITKTNVMKARTKHKESKQKYEEQVAKLQPQIDAIKKEQENIKKKADKALLQKYLDKRNDNMFPVLVKLLDGKQCGACRMTLPSKQMDKLKENKITVCEQCGRIIYID